MIRGVKGVMFGVRGFSTSALNASRQYKSVVNRQLGNKTELAVGDLRPAKLWVSKDISAYPKYPYGEARIFKRSDRGLYGGQVIEFGNQVSEMGNRSRRSWLPNVINKSLWSVSLNKMIKMKMTTRVLRTITKEGGLDNYITKEKEARIKELGIFGWNLKYDILRAREAAERPPSFEVVNGVKVYHRGTYNGKEVSVIVGKRALLRELFPAVKENSVNELAFAKFNTARASKSFEDILAECERLQVDLSKVVQV